MLKRLERKNGLSSVATLTASGSHVSTGIVWERYEMGFRDREAAHKPKITMHNVKRRLEWC